ncbi:MAG: hypothetical protein JZU53_05455 [Paludibacter sp.]|nr:hypothetical protein [Paludibacter sp.]
MSQSLIFSFVCLVVVLLWGINTLIPRYSKIRTILNVVLTIAVIVTVAIVV